jgi:hypothetical protein
MGKFNLFLPNHKKRSDQMLIKIKSGSLGCRFSIEIEVFI